MKRHNRLFAILLAIAMVVTYMPTMAFAGTDTNQSWELAQDSSELRISDNNGEATLSAWLEIGEDLSYQDIEYRWVGTDEEPYSDWTAFSEDMTAELTVSEQGTYTLEAKKSEETSASKSIYFNVRAWNMPKVDTYYLKNGSVILDATTTVDGDYAGKFSYQWCKRNREIDKWENISGANDPTYQADTIGEYGCKITETIGEGADAYTHKETYYIDVILEEGPSWYIDSQYEEEVLLENGEATLDFDIYESGLTGHYLFSWLKWNNESSEYVPITGEKGESLVVTEPGKYRCYVKETTFGDDDFTVFLVDSWLVEPKSDEVYLLAGVGTTAKLELVLKGDIPEGLTYQWFTCDSEWENEKPIDNQQSQTLVVNSEGSYLCRVYFGPDKEKDYKEVTFTVSAYDKSWRAYAKNEDVQLKAGKTAQLEIALEGSYDESNLKYQWYEGDYDEEDEDTSVPIAGEEKSSCTVAEPGWYYCKVTEEGDEVPIRVRFNVVIESIDENGVIYYPADNQSATVYGERSVRGDVSIKPSVVFSDGKEYKVTTIENFDSCNRLTSVIIPSSVSEIRGSSFVNTGLKSITIPESVKAIGEYAIGYNSEYDSEIGELKYSLVPGFVIKGYADSEAQRYAEANGIDFEIIESEDDQDEIKANEVSALINALPEEENITIEDKAAIEAARKAFDALTEAQKAKVAATTLAKLTAAETALAAAIETEDEAAAEAVKNKIDALPTSVTTADKAAIEAARKAYDALTDAQKEKVSAETLAKLTDAEAALKDATAVEPVIEQINALPAKDDVTTADKAAIEAARKAFDALTDAQKAKVDATKLTEAEAALEAAIEAEDEAAAEAVKNKIDALPTSVTTADKADIEEARAAYNALTDAQKEKVSAETLAKLTDAEAALKDATAVEPVIEQINALPAKDDVTTADKAAIEAARKAFDALTDAQKAKVDATKLTEAEAALEAAIEAEDKEKADAVIAKINDLPANITTANKTAIEEARAAYDALTDAQKAKVAPTIVDKLTAAEAALKDAEAVEPVIEKINALPAKDDVTTADKAAIKAARKAYDALTDAQKAKVDATKLTEAEAALEAAIEAEDKEKADAVTTKINELPAKEDVTTANKTAIEEARAAYNALTDAQKEKVSAETLAKLTDAEAALKDAEDEAAAEAVKNKIDALPTSVTTADKAAIEEARAAYNALTDAQKEKVSAETLAKLTDAEAALGEAQREEDRRAEEARRAAQPKEIQDLPVVKITKPKAGKKKATVKWKKVSKKNLKKIQGIEIQVASDPGFNQIVKSTTAGKKKKSKTIKGLKPKTTYWVRIRAYKNASNGKHVSAWKVKKVKIKK